MYNADKFHWLPLQPGTERFVMNRGPFGNFDTSNLTAEQLSAFFGTTATVAESGVKLRTLYVWERDTDRFTYVYNQSGKIIAAYPPPEDYDPYALARKQIESEPNITPERRDFLLKFLDPTRVVLSAAVSDGPIPISPSILEPALPGGFGMLQGGGGEPDVTMTTLSQVVGYDWVMHLNSPGIDTQIPIWRADTTLPDSGWGDPETTTISTAGHSLEKDISDENSSGLALRYYFTPYLDTAYVQAPGGESVTVKYVSDRNVVATAWLWTPGDWEGAASQPAVKTPLGSGLYLYQAVFGGVQPDTTYKYMFEWESGGETFRTSVPTTRTWPSSGGSGDFRFVVYGASHYGDDVATLSEDHRDVACVGILGGPRPTGLPTPVFVLHTGDMVFKAGPGSQWLPHFFRPAGALLGRIPVFPCLGHNEREGDASASFYRAWFDLPTQHERWYSFDYGDCHFVVLDTKYYDGDPNPDKDFEEGSLQHDWLCDDLEGSGASWKTVVMHVPAYTQMSEEEEEEEQFGFNQDQVQAVRAELAEKVFNDAVYGASIVLSGHNRFYERSYVEYSNGPGGVQYVVTGGGGAPLWDPTGGDENPYRVKAESVFHYCTVRVTDEGSRLEFRAVRLDGSEIDAFELE